MFRMSRKSEIVDHFRHVHFRPTESAVAGNGQTVAATSRLLLFLILFLLKKELLLAHFQRLSLILNPK